MSTCPSCGTENEPGRKFCGECGTALALSCPSCGAPNAPGVKFCGECGAPLAQAVVGQPAAGPVATAPATSASERRLVSVLFADLVGFTTLSESRDAEEVRELLTGYFETCQRLITRYGGAIEKFIGDAVMAVWGTPTAQEDDAERAVRAALDLTKTVTDLGQEIGAPELRARAGVLTGEAAVTIGAEGQGMVAGDLVNTASRIQSMAEPGSVFVGEVTRRATEAAIAYEDAGTHELKGKAEPVPLWRAMRVVGGTRGGMKSTSLEAPFVGRDRELRAVKDLFHATAEDRKAHLVSVTGIAGIGKSRLSWEFYKYVDGLPEVHWYHRGRCLSYGDGVTYWALAEMVRMRARITEGEEQASALAKLHATVEEHVPDPEEQRWVEPRLAHLLGLEDRSAREREDLFAAWRLFFERLAEEHATIMVFEDMQWADSALLDFIEYLLEWSRNHAIYVLTMARPEMLDRRPNWGAGKRNFTSMYLEPLPPAAMGQLLSGLVPGLPEGVRAQILERAEGVPLYAVETVRMLLDRGLLIQEGNVYRPTGPIDALEVPETLHGLIAARLDGLSSEERKAVQDASVLGKTFTKLALSFLSGLSEKELEPLLTSLVRKEILSLQADPRSPELGQYGFLQDLLRKVAYETLSRRDRKAKHLAVASYLEAAWGKEEHEIVEVVASHYVEAYRAAPDAPDAAEIKTKAREALTRAGERAASLAASEEAQRYFEQAVDLTDDLLTQAELHERAGRMARQGNRAAPARSHFEGAISGYTSLGLSHPAARVTAALADVTWGEGRIEDAVEELEQAFGVLSADEPDEDLATLVAQLGRFLWLSGRAQEAASPIEHALTMAETLGLSEILSQALNTKGGLLFSQDRRQEGTVLLQHALKVALENDLSSAAIRAYINLASFLGDQDRHRESEAMLLKGLELARSTGYRHWEMAFLTGIVLRQVVLGDWAEAAAGAESLRTSEDFGPVRGGLVDILAVVWVKLQRSDLESARDWLSLFPGIGTSRTVQFRAVYRTMQAALFREEGKLKEALKAGEGVLEARDELGVAFEFVKWGLVETLEAAFALDDRGKIEELLRIIEVLRPGELTPYLQAQGARFGARLAALRGEPEGVDPGFKAAAGILRELSMPFWLAVTLLEHGEWLLAQNQAEEAQPLLTEAREIFDQLKAKPWLKRVAAAAPLPVRATG